MAGPAVILITDPAYSIDHIGSVIARVAAALPPGAVMVQLRDKASPFVRVSAYAQLLRDVTRKAGARLVLNAIRDEAGPIVDLCKQIEADGVHVACASTTIASARAIATWVSVPVHDDDELRTASLARVDAMLVSPIFATPGKGRPRGVAALAAAAGHGRARVYALGGVTAEHAPMCASAGAHGVAVIRALLGADDPVAVARALAAPFAEV